MKIFLLLVLLLASVLMINGEHLVVGDASQKRLIHHTVAEYHSVPFMKRVKDVFYSSPDQQVISAITVYDNLHSKASATVTAGGLGQTYVNIRLKSERGEGLDYDVGIYA